MGYNPQTARLWRDGELIIISRFRTRGCFYVQSLPIKMHLSTLIFSAGLLASAAVTSATSLQHRDLPSLLTLVSEFKAEVNEDYSTVCTESGIQDVDTSDGSTVMTVLDACFNVTDTIGQDVARALSGLKTPEEEEPDFLRLRNLGDCIKLTHPRYLEYMAKCDAAVCKGDEAKLKKAEEERNKRVELAYEYCPKIAGEYRRVLEEGFEASLPVEGYEVGTRTADQVVTSMLKVEAPARTVGDEAWEFTTLFTKPTETGDKEEPKKGDGDKGSGAAGIMVGGSVGVMAVVGLSFGWTLLGALNRF